MKKVSNYMTEKLDPTFNLPRLLKNLVRAGWWGKEYRKGFHQYCEEKNK